MKPAGGVERHLASSGVVSALKLNNDNRAGLMLSPITTTTVTGSALRAACAWVCPWMLRLVAATCVMLIRTAPTAA